MEENDFRRLMKNLTRLKERLGKQPHDFDIIIDCLIEKGIFLFNKKEEIFSGKTDSQKMDIFLKSLRASGPMAYEEFRAALMSFKDNRYDDVVTALDRTELTFVQGDASCRTVSQQGAIPKREVTFYSTPRSMSVMTNQADTIADLASKLDQVLESQSKMREQIREDVQAEFKNMNSKIESIKQTQEKKERTKYKDELVKLETENTELMEKSDTLQKQADSLQKRYDSLKEQLRYKNETVNNLIKENQSLKSKLNQTDRKQLTQNKSKIKELQNDIKIIKNEKEKLERENTVLRRTNSFYNLPHPRASLPKLENPPVVKTCTTYQYIIRNNKNTGTQS